MRRPPSDVAICLALALAACGTTDAASSQPGSTSPDPKSAGADLVTVDCPAKPPDPNRAHVMVVDHGFDVRHPIFAGKIAGCYRLSCPDGGPGFAAKPGETDDEAADRMRTWLSTPSPDCVVEPGMSVVVDRYLDDFDPAERDEWNDSVLGKHRVPVGSQLDVQTLLLRLNGIVDDRLDPLGLTPPTVAYAYHGTATAGAIAYRNDVDIVFVDRPIAEPGQNPAPPCIPPSELDVETRLLQRPDVQDAYIHAPLSGEEAALHDLRKRHGVQLENKSYGPPTRAAIEATFFVESCPEVDLARYLAVVGDLDAKREAFLRSSGALDGADPLLFEAAGNDGDTIDTAADDPECTPGRERRLLVGSYDIYRGRAALSGFSNDGDCVDLYAFGEDVVLPAPAGFYVPLSGTSFAAPLALRYASRLRLGRSDLSAIRDEVLGARDENRFLPVSAMPAELSFLGSTAPIDAPTLQSLGAVLSSLPGRSGAILRGAH